MITPSELHQYPAWKTWILQTKKSRKLYGKQRVSGVVIGVPKKEKYFRNQ